MATTKTQSKKQDVPNDIELRNQTKAKQTIGTATTSGTNVNVADIYNSLTDTYGVNLGTTFEESHNLGLLLSSINPFERHNHSTSSKNIVSPVARNANSKIRIKTPKNVRFSQKNHNINNNNSNSNISITIKEENKDLIENNNNNSLINLRNIPNIKELESVYLTNYYKQNKIEFSFRAICIGLIIGGLFCFLNVYFGLESGNIIIGSLQSSCNLVCIICLFLIDYCFLVFGDILGLVCFLIFFFACLFLK